MINNSKPASANQHGFFVLYLICVTMMILNFFLTPNPFSALHSGHTFEGYRIHSETFLITPAYLVLISLGLILIRTNRLILSYKIVIMIFILITSGMYTEAIMTNTTSYLYNIMVLALIASASLSSYILSDGEFKDEIKIAKILTLILVIGIVVSILFPYRFGYLPFEFSRYSRGEVTLWNVTGLFVVYPTLALLIFRKYKKKFFIVLSLIMIIVVLSTATRSDATLTMLPFIVYILFNAKVVYKFIFGFISLLTLPFFLNPIIDFFLGVNTNYSTDISNGRFELWGYHFDVATQHPFLGAGAFFINKVGSYSGTATSEVGALMWFSENGFIYGLIMLSFIVAAVFMAIKLLAKGGKAKDTEFFFSLIFLSMLPNLTQSYGRILSVQDVLFWFSMFYLNWHYKPLLPHFDIFRGKRITLKKSI